MNRRAGVRVLCLILATLIPGSLIASDATMKENTSETLARLERDWSAAYLRHDAARIAEILADDYVGIDGRGVVTDKEQEIRDAASPAPGTQAPDWVISTEEIVDIAVREYGNVAVVTARSIESGTFKKQPLHVQYRRTTVYVSRSGKWQCVSFHASRIIAQE